MTASESSKSSAWTTTLFRQRRLLVALVLGAGVCVTLFVCLQQGLLGFKPTKDDTLGIQDWLVVPVFYATNRTFVGSDSQIDYSASKNGDKLLFGVKNIIVPMPATMVPDKTTIARLRWQCLHTSEAGKPPQLPTNCAVPDRRLELPEIAPAFANYKTVTNSKDAVVFVHGCCASFNTSMRRAAKIGAYMETPVVLYDWVSPEGFRQYLQNETHAQQAMDNFWNFLTRVEKRADSENIIVLGHSMGALFVDEAMVRRSIRDDGRSSAPHLKQIILSNPDLDAATFLNHAEQFAANAKSTLLFLSRNDDRLSASAVAHGGYPRLGAPGNMAQDLSKVNGITVIDITDADTGHEIPFWVLGSIHKNGSLAPNSGFQLQTLAPQHLSVIKSAKER